MSGLRESFAAGCGAMCSASVFASNSTCPLDDLKRNINLTRVVYDPQHGWVSNFNTIRPQGSEPPAYNSGHVISRSPLISSFCLEFSMIP